MTARRTILLAAGGTGGHVFPALALADELAKRHYDVALLTDARGAKYGATPSGPRRIVLPAGNIAGAGGVGKAVAAFRMGMGLVAALIQILRFRPAALVSFGGYPSLAPSAAAWVTRTPLLLHEQNAILGRANRLAARWATMLATSFDAVTGLPASCRFQKTGNPVREAIARLGEAPYRGPNGNGSIRLLIVGGSQGARLFSDLIPQAILALPPAVRSRLEVAHQVRHEDIARVRTLYGNHGVNADIEAFFADMPRRLGEAHLVIARAGSSTVNELAAAGRPAILIPFAKAAEDHQTANARALVDGGGAVMLSEDLATAEALAKILENIALHRLESMAMAARAAAMPDAVRRLADLAESMVRS